MSLCVTFLGTSGAVPTSQRNTSAVFLRREGERFLFDCGEGTQRQMIRFSTGFAISHVFVSHLHGDHVLGIPGLLQTLDFNDREAPLAIHVPAEGRAAMRELLEIPGTNPAFPVRINGVQGGDIAVDGDGFDVRAFETTHNVQSVGYVLEEDKRKGRFDRERAEELGVPVGPKFHQLHEGESVQLDDGTVVRSEQVVGEPRPGRTVVYTGDTRPTSTTTQAASDAELLIHDGTFADADSERAERTGHSTVREAAVVGNDAGVERLALIHISSRYAGETASLEREAQDVFGGQRVCIPDDGDSVDIPFPE